MLETISTIDRSRFHYVLGAMVRPHGRSSELYDEAVQRDATAYRILERGRLDLSVLAEIRQVTRRECIHVIHTHGFRTDLIGLLCARREKVPVVTTLHGWITNDLRGKIYKSMNFFILQHFQHVVAVSDRIRREVLARGIAPDRITLVRNAIVLDRLTPRDNDKRFRDELGIGAGTVLVGSIGRLSAEKGQKHLVRAASAVTQRHDDIRFVFLGVGPEQERLKKLVRQKGLERHFVFAGYREDMEAVYNGLDLVVQSSYTEGMPNVIIESLLMRTPVIATAVGGTSEIVTDGVNGTLIEPGRPDVLAREIGRFLDNRDEMTAMADRGRDTIVQYYGFEHRTRLLEDIYDRMLRP
jgi:glycosyltransferase involved in cell wall biosynthesis